MKISIIHLLNKLRRNMSAVRQESAQIVEVQILNDSGNVYVPSIKIVSGQEVSWTCRTNAVRVLFNSSACPFKGAIFAATKGATIISGRAEIDSPYRKYNYSIILFTNDGLVATTAELTVTT